MEARAVMQAKPEFAMRSGWTVACLALLVAVASASRPQTLQGNHNAQPPTQRASLTSVLRLDKSVYDLARQPAGQIHATLRLTNHGKDTLTLKESGHTLDCTVMNDKGKVVWNYAHGRMFPHFRMLRLLEGGASADYPVDVPLRDNQGLPLAPGRYKLHGRLLNGTGAEAEAAFTVVGVSHEPAAPTVPPALGDKAISVRSAD